MTMLQIKSVNKKYSGMKNNVLTDINLTVNKGEILVLLGPSGCGKTTLLKMIAGLEKCDSGTISIDGEDMKNMPPNKRPAVMVFQKALMFKNMTVGENVGYAPRMTGTLKKEELKEKTLQMLKLVNLEGYENKHSTELSGGQEQRVSLARALITEPKLLLLDEPFSALDAELRIEMRSNVRDICKSLNQTVVFVTHDQQEAMAIADKIAVIINGEVVQYGVPKDFYTKPKTNYVAKFFGWQNFIDAEKIGNIVKTPLGSFEFDDLEREDGNVSYTIRPEAFILNENGKYSGKIIHLEYFGLNFEYDIDVSGTKLHMSVASRYIYHIGDIIKFDIDEKMTWVVERCEI